MRRAERAFDEPEALLSTLRRCRVAFIAFAGEPPYVVPMNFGAKLEGGRFSLYLHGAGEGEKHARIARDDRAAFAAVASERLLIAQTACGFSEAYESVCGDGRVSYVEGEEKKEGLRLLMAQLAPGGEWTFKNEAVDAVTVMRLDVERISGKRRVG